MLYFLTRSLFLFYFSVFCRHKVYGQENIIAGRCIIAPNHASFWDPPLISASWPTAVTFLARKSLFKTRFTSWILRCLHTYPVGGTTDDLSSLKTIGKLLKENKAVVIFPEGTRTHDDSIQPIKSGIGMLSLRNEADIIPVYISGTFELWPRSQKFPSLLGRTSCIIGKPIHWKEFAHLPRKEAYEEIARRTATALEELKKSDQIN